MAKRQVIGLNEVWWVWVGEQDAIRVETEAEARTILLAEEREYGVANSFGRCNTACPVAELVWDTPLPEGKTYHKPVLSPVMTVLHRGQLRRILFSLSPSKLAGVSKGWYALKSVPPWWPQQYHAAMNDSEVLVLRGKKPVEDQLNSKWPYP